MGKLLERRASGSWLLEKSEKNFGGFEKVATFAAPFEKTREARKKIIEKTGRLSTRKYN